MSGRVADAQAHAVEESVAGSLHAEEPVDRANSRGGLQPVVGCEPCPLVQGGDVYGSVVNAAEVVEAA
jgi:hypothetical protein